MIIMIIVFITVTVVIVRNAPLTSEQQELQDPILMPASKPLLPLLLLLLALQLLPPESAAQAVSPA